MMVPASTTAAQFAVAAAVIMAIAGMRGVTAELTMEKVGGFAGDADATSFEVVAVKPSTTVSVVLKSCIGHGSGHGGSRS